MQVKSFKRKTPDRIFAFQFLGEEYPNHPWLKTCGTKLAPEERIGKFWNSLHNTELEVEYGDWIVCNDMNLMYSKDRCPICSTEWHRVEHPIHGKKEIWEDCLKCNKTKEDIMETKNINHNYD